MTVRRARPAEHETLTALSLRSKAAWGYDDDFMRRCLAELTITSADIALSDAFVAEGPGGSVDGFCLVRCAPPLARLVALFVEPCCMRTGVGRQLWWTAVSAARETGASILELDADPNAEDFYLAMGAHRVGEVPSDSIPGRMLPLMAFALS